MAVVQGYSAFHLAAQDPDAQVVVVRAPHAQSLLVLDLLVPTECVVVLVVGLPDALDHNVSGTGGVQVMTASALDALDQTVTMTTAVDQAGARVPTVPRRHAAAPIATTVSAMGQVVSLWAQILAEEQVVVAVVVRVNPRLPV
jgi:hypothetical protein